MREEILEDSDQMAMFIGRNRKARVTYGFDEIALVPGQVTINPNEVDITFEIPTRTGDPLKLGIPIMASAMDGVVDVPFAVEMGKLGGLAVLNLEGVQTRYKNPEEVLLKVLEAEKEHVTALLQKIYQEPGADIFVVQSTVSTVRHVSNEYRSLDLAKLCKDLRCPVIVGNTVGFE